METEHPPRDIFIGLLAALSPHVLGRTSKSSAIWLAQWNLSEQVGSFPSRSNDSGRSSKIKARVLNRNRGLVGNRQ